MKILNTLCTRCQAPLECQWPDECSFGGELCTPEEYMAKALRSESVMICCDKCLSEMTDVRLEDMILSE